MTITYEQVYAAALPMITDFNPLELTESDLNEMLSGWLHYAKSLPSVKSLFSKLTLDDTTTEIEFELKTSIDEENDKDVVILILALGMKIAWYQPQVNSILNTSQMFGGKEEKFYSQANHINSVVGNLFKEAKKELRDAIRDYKYFNGTYTGGGIKG